MSSHSSSFHTSRITLPSIQLSDGESPSPVRSLAEGRSSSSNSLAHSASSNVLLSVTPNSTKVRRWMKGALSGAPQRESLINISLTPSSSSSAALSSMGDPSPRASSKAFPSAQYRYSRIRYLAAIVALTLVIIAVLCLAALGVAGLRGFAPHNFTDGNHGGVVHPRSGGGFLGKALSTGDKKLVVLIPFIVEDIHHIFAGMKKWAALGPACDLTQEVKYGLRFYYSRGLAEYGTSPYVEQLMMTDANVAKNVAPCFDSIQTTFAELTEAEDGYPEGPSNMFFKLHIQQASTMLAPYTHVYWMEWDVKPVRPFWVDKLYDLTLHDDFWMKGGRYRGRAFDEVIKDSSSWGWVGHLNGNALYKLHDPAFIHFLQLTMEREPPSHFWKPFDIAIWRTLCDFPYSWHFYQTHGDKFQTTTAIQHLGFTGTDDEFNAVINHQPNVFVIHGDKGSAGLSKYLNKFKDGRPRSNLTISWVDEVSANMRVSIFIRTNKDDFGFAAIAIQSAQRFFPGALEYVVVVPEADAQQARQELPSNIVLYAEKAAVKSEDMQQKMAKLLADKYCMGDYVFHLEADVIFHRPVLRRDLFIFDKPLITFDRYRNLEWKEEENRRRLPPNPARANLTVNATRARSVRRWQEPTSFALGEPVEFEFSRANDHLYHRRVYAEAREHLEKTHRQTVAEFLDTRESGIRWGANGEPLNGPGSLFSEMNYLGAFLYYQRPELMSWTFLGTETAPKYSLPYEYTSIRPDVVCQGDRWMKREGGWMATQLAIMARVVAGQSSCGELTGWLGSLSTE